THTHTHTHTHAHTHSFSHACVHSLSLIHRLLGSVCNTNMVSAVICCSAFQKYQHASSHSDVQQTQTHTHTHNTTHTHTHTQTHAHKLQSTKFKNTPKRCTLILAT